jgi:Electron transfer DM13
VIGRLLRQPLTWIAVAALAASGVFGLYWFQPWKLVTDKNVNETLADVPAAAASPSGPAVTPPSASAATPPSGPLVIRQGAFITHEHDTDGTARVIRNPDGSHRLELVDLNTSNGPDLRVWLSDQPVKKGVAGWRVFDDGDWVELGRLKGNKGDQAYAIPAGTDLDRLGSVSIWCKRFAVSFGAATLTPT